MARSRSSRTRCCSTTSSTGRRGTCWRSRTAAADDPGHLGPPLDLGDLGRLDAAGVEAREELPDRAEHDAGLAQRRQHLPDVAQEGGVRADDEHAAAGQPVAVGVEQVGRPVQRDGRLAGARPALHDQHPGRCRPDDPVLLGLDRRDDVAHPAGAPGGHRRQQRGLAGQSGAAAGRARRRRGRAPRRRRPGPRGAACAGAGGGACPRARRRWRCRTAAPRAHASPSAAARTRAPRRAGRAGRCSAAPPSRCRAARTPGRARPRGAPRAGPCTSRRRRRARSGPAGCRRSRRAGPTGAGARCRRGARRAGRRAWRHSAARSRGRRRRRGVDVTEPVVGGTVLRTAPGGPGTSGAEHGRGAVGHRAISPFEPGTLMPPAAPAAGRRPTNLPAWVFSHRWPRVASRVVLPSSPARRCGRRD